MSVLLDMDRHLKERLVGAAVLVLIAVLFVPELLSGPSRPHNAAPAVAVSDVPTNTTPALRTYRVNLDHPASQVPLPEAGAPPAPQSPLPSAVQAQSAPPARSEPKIELLPAVRPAEASGETHAASRPQPRGEAHADARAEAPADNRPANSFAPIGEKGGWSIQLGSFANKANAEKLARGLRAKGVRVYVTQGGGKHRVRAGPFADRASAERMAGRLRAQGQSVSIIAP